MTNISDSIVLFRMAERIGLTLIIVIISVIVMIGFWRTIQKFDITGSKAPLGLSGSFALTTPVFVLLTLVGYTWVSLSHPISTTSATTSKATQTASSGESVTFTGMQSAGPAIGQTEKLRANVEGQIKSLNCLLIGDLSPRLEDDSAEIKLALMEQVWSNDWGAFDAFAAFARGQTAAVNIAAENFFINQHVAC